MIHLKQAIIRLETERMHALISKMKSDKVFQTKFDGHIGNGRVEGFYTNLVRSQTGISFLKISGNYDLNKGELHLNLKPSNVFYASLTFSIIFLLISIYGFITNDLETIPIVGTLIIGFALGLTQIIGFNAEKKKFEKHLYVLNDHSL